MLNYKSALVKVLPVQAHIYIIMCFLMDKPVKATKNSNKIEERMTLAGCESFLRRLKVHMYKLSLFHLLTNYTISICNLFMIFANKNKVGIQKSPNFLHKHIITAVDWSSFLKWSHWKYFQFPMDLKNFDEQNFIFKM